MYWGTKSGPEEIQGGDEQRQWQAPTSGQIKINVYGPWVLEFCWECCLVKHFSGGQCYPGPACETLAVLKGFELSTFFQLSNLLVDTDCLNAVRGVKNAGMDRSNLEHLFELL